MFLILVPFLCSLKVNFFVNIFHSTIYFRYNIQDQEGYQIAGGNQCFSLESVIPHFLASHPIFLSQID